MNSADWFQSVTCFKSESTVVQLNVFSLKTSEVSRVRILPVAFKALLRKKSLY